MIKHFCSYITDNGAIAAHVNREFGTSVTSARVAEIRATLSKVARVDGKRVGANHVNEANAQAIDNENPGITHWQHRTLAADANAAFMRAMRKAHPERVSV